RIADTLTVHLPRRGRPNAERPTIHACRGERQSSRLVVHARRADPPYDAGLPLHRLLSQRLRGESVSGEPRICSALSELPIGHHVWPPLPRSAQQRVARIGGI